MRLLLSILFVGILANPFVTAAEPNQSGTPGFSTEKPAEGPSVAVEGGFLVPYTLQVPGTEVQIEMVPIPGGSYLLGSSEDSEFHVEDEGPQVKIEIGPMWVAKYETTWE